jgi:hypothetical protein
LKGPPVKAKLAPLSPIIKHTRFSPLETDPDSVLVSDIYVENNKVQKKNTCIPFLNATDLDKLVKLRAKKKAPGTQTGATNTDDKKGAKCAMAQSKQQTTKLCVPAGLEEAPEELEPHPTLPNVFKTKVPFGLRRKEASKWLARRAMGIAENRLQEELREFQVGITFPEQQLDGLNVCG